MRRSLLNIHYVSMNTPKHTRLEILERLNNEIHEKRKGRQLSHSAPSLSYIKPIGAPDGNLSAVGLHKTHSFSLST